MKALLDSNVLLDYPDILDNTEYEYIIHSIVCEEIDNIIHNSLDQEKKYKARKARNAIKNNKKIEFSLHIPSYSLPLGWDINKHDNDLLRVCKDLGCLLITNDLAMQIKAGSIGVKWREWGNYNKDELYKGYKEIILTDEELALHYENPTNRWNLLVNEYLIIKNEKGEVVDKQRFSEKGFVPLSTKTFKSMYLDDFKPKDVYQMCCMDSLINTDFTIITGAAGSGKTLVALSYIMQGIQNGKINKAIIVFNPAKLRGNEALGFYSGDRTQKLLQNSIGGILSSKFGDMQQVEGLISQGKLMLIPTSDIRGIEISDKDVLYVTEAQNTDTYTMRTIIQRAKEGTKIIVEGDILEQQDIKINSIRENGMYKAIEVFKGTSYFSCIKLENVYRSPIAEIAQRI